MPHTSADESKITSNHGKIGSSFDTYPSSVTSDNFLINKNMNNNGKNMKTNNNNTGKREDIYSNKHIVNNTIKKEVRKETNPIKLNKSKKLDWACSNDFPYVPSVQSLPYSTPGCTYNLNEAENPNLHVLYQRSHKCSGHSSFYESNMKLTNEQRELQKQIENDV